MTTKCEFYPGGLVLPDNMIPTPEAGDDEALIPAAELAQKAKGEPYSYYVPNGGEGYDAALTAYTADCEQSGAIFQQPERGCWVDVFPCGCRRVTLTNARGFLFQHEVGPCTQLGLGQGHHEMVEG